VIAYKFLGEGGTARFSRFTWPLPGAGRYGEWVDAHPSVCATGIHACRTADLPYWIDAQLWRIELDGDIVEGTRKVVAERGRLVDRVEAWDTDAKHGFGRACATRADALAGSLPALRAYADDAAVFAEAGNPAVAGFVAARLAELTGGVESYESERDAQVRWLAENLALTA